MMMKGFGLDESIMSNLTSTLSGETSISSNTRNESSSTTTTNNTAAMLYPQASPSPFTSPNQGQLPPPQPPPAKKKRSLPGNPDPDAEVIALSPKSLLATNRFICEICNKGFQRDQNLQLHRRGHNLPWKLKQRPKGELIRKKVYVCPEPSCAHHDPSRALGDLTGIKKHFCRKHGEKKWKCDKCSKKYAVQSDWKAHSKICGTKEYRCDCGTLFSRRDSFITHRAFCDALAAAEDHHSHSLSPLPSSSLKTDHHPVHVSFPPWLSPPPPQQHQPAGPHLFAAPQMSATALLQKAAEMGVTLMSSTTQGQDDHHHVTGGCSSTSAAGMCSSRDLHDMMLISSLQSTSAGGGFGNPDHQLLLYDNTNSNTNTTTTTNNNNEQGNQGVVMMTSGSGGGGGGNPPPTTGFNGGGSGGGGGGGDGLSLSTRDFLGLRRITQNEYLINMAAEQLRAQINSSNSPTSYDHHHHHDHQQHDHQNQNQTPW